jgi:putative membrane protein
MNRKALIQKTTTAVFAITLGCAYAANEGKIGKMDGPDFAKTNKEAAAKVEAIKPSSDALSQTDRELLGEITMGGMLQLHASQVAVERAQSADVKAYAQAEVEEQTGLAAKLKEIAEAKGTTLPTDYNDHAKKVVGKLKEASAEDFDREYLKASGVEGHEALKKTMEKVKESAADPALKAIADAALPLIEIHWGAAKDEMDDLK